jgi:hypothetical protein
MSTKNRRAYRRTGIFQDLYGSDHGAQNDIGILREYDRSTPWFYIGSGGGAPGFSNSWTNLGSGWGTARYMRDAAGIVHLQGLLSNAFNVAGATMFQLPEGFRIGQSNIFSLLRNFGGAYDFLELQVNTNGIFVAQYNVAAGATVSWMSLAGVSYPAEL